jgi:hypothetical protein
MTDTSGKQLVLYFSQMIVFLDWDDCILPTTFLRCHRHLFGAIGENSKTSCIPLSEELNQLLSDLEKVVLKFIQFILNDGHQILLVSNSSAKWIQFTAEMFFSETFLNMLTNIECHSARPTNLIEPCREASLHWKSKKFHELILTCEDASTVISIGDGYAEREAVFYLKRLLLVDQVKSVKFDAEPCIQLMIDQFEALTRLWTDILKYPNSGDVYLFNDGFRVIEQKI